MLERKDSIGTSLARPRRARWPWLVLAGVAGALKARGIEEVTHHRPEVIAVLALVLAATLLRPKPVVIAATAAGLVAFGLAPHPVGAGIALGVGAFVVFMLVFFAIATILRVRQRR